MNQAIKLNTDCPVFLTKESIDFLNELFHLCMYESKPDKAAFWKAVLKASKANAIHEITEDHFEAAILKAKEILKKRSLIVFSHRASRDGILAFKRERRYYKEIYGGQLSEDLVESKAEQEEDEILEIIK